MENFYTNLIGWSGNIMPENAFEKLKSSFLPQWRVCFFAAFIVGLLTHFYKITSWLPNWDSLVFRYDAQNMLGLGRWFLPVVCSLSSFYDLPFLNGVLAIVFHAFGSVCICEILKVKNNITAFLIGGFIVSFPAVTSVLMYNYVADGYSIAFFLSCFAAVYVTSDKPKYLLSAVLIALSAGIYQAYITVTVMLVIIHLFDELIFRKKDAIYIVKKSACIFLAGASGIILYYVILKILLTVYSVTLLDYQGLNSAFLLSDINLPGSVYAVKEIFLNYFFDFSNGLNLFIILNILVAGFTALFYIKYVIGSKVLKSPLKVFLLIVLGVLSVMGASILAFINAEVDYHNLMLMGYCVYYLFFIILYERGFDIKEKITSFKLWTVVLISLVVIFNQIVIANVSYHKAQMSYEKSYGVLIRIADRIEQTENAENCDEILVIGALEGSKEYSVNFPPDMTGITDGYIIRSDDETVGQSVLCSALNDYCRKEYGFVSGERKKALLENEKIKNMNKWPSKDCIAVIDNIIVIKLGSESE